MPNVEHLKLIETVTGRMASNSFLIKGWTVTLVAGLNAFASAKTDHRVAWIAVGVVVVFAVLDAFYLALERAYRELYKRVVTDPRPLSTGSLRSKSGRAGREGASGIRRLPALSRCAGGFSRSRLLVTRGAIGACGCLRRRDSGRRDHQDRQYARAAAAGLSGLAAARRPLRASMALELRRRDQPAAVRAPRPQTRRPTEEPVSAILRTQQFWDSHPERFARAGSQLRLDGRIPVHDLDNFFT